MLPSDAAAVVKRAPAGAELACTRPSVLDIAGPLYSRPLATSLKPCHVAPARSRGSCPHPAAELGRACSRSSRLSAPARFLLRGANGGGRTRAAMLGKKQLAVIGEVELIDWAAPPLI